MHSLLLGRRNQAFQPLSIDFVSTGFRQCVEEKKPPWIFVRCELGFHEVLQCARGLIGLRVRATGQENARRADGKRKRRGEGERDVIFTCIAKSLVLLASWPRMPVDEISMRLWP